MEKSRKGRSEEGKRERKAVSQVRKLKEGGREKGKRKQRKKEERKAEGEERT